METQIENIILVLREDGAEDTQSMLDALEDGVYLATKNWTQEDVEEAYNLLKGNK